MGFTNAVEISGGLKHLLVRHANGKVTCLKVGSSGAPEVYTNSFCWSVTTASRISAGSVGDAVLLSNKSFVFGNALTSTSVSKTFTGSPTPVPIDVAAGTNLTYAVLFSNGVATAFKQTTLTQYNTTTGVVSVAAGGDSLLLAVRSDGENGIFNTSGTSWSYTSLTNRLLGARDKWWRRNTRIAVSETGCLVPMNNAAGSARRLDFLGSAVTPGGLSRGIAMVCSGTCPTNRFSDAGLMPDGWQVFYGLDPRDSADDYTDADGDGLTNFVECEHGTNPFLRDTDGDEYDDKWEIDNGFDPTDPADTVADPDGDGLTNAREHILGTDPALYDTDGDGLSDGAETEIPFLTLWDSAGDTGRVFTACAVAQVTASDTARAALLTDGRVIVFTGSGSGLKACTNDCGAIEIDATESWIAAITEAKRVTVWREMAGGSLTNSDAGLTNVVGLSGGYRHLLALHGGGSVTCLTNGPSGSPMVWTNKFCNLCSNVVTLAAGTAGDAAVFTNGNVLLGNVFAATQPVLKPPTFGWPAEVAAGSNLNFIVHMTNGLADAYYGSSYTRVAGPTGVLFVAAGGSSNMVAVLSNGSNAVFSSGRTTWSYTVVTNRLKGASDLWWKRDCGLAVTNGGYLLPIMSASASGRTLDYFASAVTPRGLRLGIAAACSGTCATNRDMDMDGMLDGYEVLYELNPHNAADAGADPDGDGLCNLVESQWKTNPFKKDTDGDGMPDWWEVLYEGLNPCNPADAALDFDSDGLSNIEEYLCGTNPLIANTMPPTESVHLDFLYDSEGRLIESDMSGKPAEVLSLTPAHNVSEVNIYKGE